MLNRVLQNRWIVRLVSLLAMLAIVLSGIDILGGSISPSATRARDYLLPGVFLALGLFSWALARPTAPFAISKRARSITNWSALLFGGAVLLFWGLDIYSAFEDAGPLALLDWPLMLPFPLAAWCVLRSALNLSAA